MKLHFLTCAVLVQFSFANAFLQRLAFDSIRIDTKNKYKYTQIDIKSNSFSRKCPKNHIIVSPAKYCLGVSGVPFSSDIIYDMKKDSHQGLSGELFSPVALVMFQAHQVHDQDVLPWSSQERDAIVKDALNAAEDDYFLLRDSAQVLKGTLDAMAQRFKFGFLHKRKFSDLRQNLLRQIVRTAYWKRAFQWFVNRQLQHIQKLLGDEEKLSSTLYNEAIIAAHTLVEFLYQNSVHAADAFMYELIQDEQFHNDFIMFLNEANIMDSEIIHCAHGMDENSRNDENIVQSMRRLVNVYFQQEVNEINPMFWFKKVQSLLQNNAVESEKLSEQVVKQFDAFSEVAFLLEDVVKRIPLTKDHVINIASVNDYPLDYPRNQQVLEMWACFEQVFDLIQSGNVTDPLLWAEGDNLDFNGFWDQVDRSIRKQLNGYSFEYLFVINEDGSMNNACKKPKRKSRGKKKHRSSVGSLDVALSQSPKEESVTENIENVALDESVKTVSLENLNEELVPLNSGELDEEVDVVQQELEKTKAKTKKKSKRRTNRNNKYRFTSPHPPAKEEVTKQVSIEDLPVSNKGKRPAEDFTESDFTETETKTDVTSIESDESFSDEEADMEYMENYNNPVWKTWLQYIGVKKVKTEEIEAKQEESYFVLAKNHYNVFMSIFKENSFVGSVRWEDLQNAFKAIGFQIDSRGAGSSFTFSRAAHAEMLAKVNLSKTKPCDEDPVCSLITRKASFCLHRPHPRGSLESHHLTRLRIRLQRRFLLNIGMFVMQS